MFLIVTDDGFVFLMAIIVKGDGFLSIFACEKSAGENGAILTCGTPFPTEHLSFVSHICQMPTTSPVSCSPNLMTKFENSAK